MGKRYCLPLVAMVEIMRSSPGRVLLQSQLASLPGVSKRKCLAQVILEQGTVHTCTIRGETGAVLVEQQKAYAALARSGDLDWEIVAAPSTSRSSGYLNNAPNLGTPPPAGYPNSVSNPGTPLPAGYPNSVSNPGTPPPASYLNSEPNPGSSRSSGYLNNTPTSGPLGEMPEISRTQDTPWTVPRAPVTPRPQEAPWIIPRLRITPLSREILASLPHASRTALMLVDSKRSLDEIAQLLNKTPQDIQQILANLPNIVQM